MVWLESRRTEYGHRRPQLVQLAKALFKFAHDPSQAATLTVECAALHQKTAFLVRCLRSGDVQLVTSEASLFPVLSPGTFPLLDESLVVGTPYAIGTPYANSSH